MKFSLNNKEALATGTLSLVDVQPVTVGGDYNSTVKHGAAAAEKISQSSACTRASSSSQCRLPQIAEVRSDTLHCLLKQDPTRPGSYVITRCRIN